MTTWNLSQQYNEPIYDQISDQCNEPIYDQISQQYNDQMSQQLNEPIISPFTIVSTPHKIFVAPTKKRVCFQYKWWYGVIFIIVLII